MEAERLGVSELWLTEDYCERGSISLLGAILASTSSMVVGVGVINPWTRHPMLIAMELATLIELAPGRVVLGLGASNRRWMEDELGISYTRPLRVLREATEIIRRALSGGVFNYEGEIFHIQGGLEFEPPAVVPIVLGVKNPQAMKLAREVADGVLLPVLAAPAYVHSVRSQIRPDQRLMSYVVFWPEQSGRSERQQLRHLIAEYLGAQGDQATTRAAGIDPDKMQAFRAGWLDGRQRDDLVDDDLVDKLVVAGTPEECAAAFARFQHAQLDTLVVRDDGVSSPATLISAVSRSWAMLGE